ncbi:MAG: hypothetical protein KDB14_19620 [Planctomycetales bacterium]|nr:hypothetical protein [Planctomycetales bacterium]
MRIAFDLDDTLIPGRIPFPVEPRPHNPLKRMFCSEELRLGTAALITDLRECGHEVWLYTTSFRGIRPLKWMFWAYGAPVGGVVNVPVHRRRMEQLEGVRDGHREGAAGRRSLLRCSKYPPAFEIDLLVDNCEGIVIEAQQYQFEVLQVQPDDPHWDRAVRNRVGIN